MRKCRAIIRETGLRCGKPATMPIYSQSYETIDMDNFNVTGKVNWITVAPKLLGYECPKHAGEFDLLRLACDALVTQNMMGKN